MKIQEIIMSDKLVKKLVSKLDQRFVLSKYERVIPDRFMDKWFKTKPSVKDLALFYLGVRQVGASSMPSILSQLIRLEKWDVSPCDDMAHETLANVDFWAKWYVDNGNEILDQKNLFLEGKY